MAKDNLKVLLDIEDLKKRTEGLEAVELGNLATLTIPTTDPEVVGEIWLDGTTLKVSEGED
jgi:hypothetical protein